MADKWRKATAGQVDLVIYPGGTQGSEADSVKRMNIGQLQAGMLSVGGLTEIDPAVAALQEIPMLFRSLAEEEYVRDKLRPDLEKRAARRRDTWPCSGPTAAGSDSSREARRRARPISRT